MNAAQKEENADDEPRKGLRIHRIASQSWGLTPLHQIATGDSDNILWRLATTKRSLNPPLPWLVLTTEKKPRFTRRLDELPPL